MPEHILDNPVWHTLNGPHLEFSQGRGDTRWFVPDVAPFVAVPSEAATPALDEAFAAALGERAYFVGVLPKTLPTGWRYASRSRVLQMQPRDGLRGDHAVGEVLEPQARDAMVTLAQIAFPDFFRRRTAELGVYLGVFDAAKLVAMAGERMRLPGFQEISGVCTHPDFTGRGYARALTLHLLQRHRARGVQSFLHVSEANVAARRLYDAMGFIVRADLELGLVERHVQ